MQELSLDKKGNLHMIWARVYQACSSSGARPDRRLLPSLSQGGYAIIYIAANDALACHLCASKPNLGSDIVDVDSTVCHDVPLACAFCGKLISGKSE
jgi:hypothetical protein